jgi:hypothetical protein
MTPGGWNPPGAYPSWPPAQAFYGGPVPFQGRLRAKASGSVALPIIGSLLVLLCLLALPWVHIQVVDKWEVLPQITGQVQDGTASFGAWYISGWCYPLAFFAILYAFAANLDSPVFRWLHFGFWVPVVLFTFVGILVVSRSHEHNAAGEDLGKSHLKAGAIEWAVLTLIIAVLFFGLAFAKGITGRVLGALMMIGYLLVHTIALIDIMSKHLDLLPFAFAATVGYLLCAIGAIIGPRYVPPTPFR